MISRLIQLRRSIAVLRQEEQELSRKIKSTHTPGNYGAFKIIMRPSRTITIKQHKELRLV